MSTLGKEECRQAAKCEAEVRVPRSERAKPQSGEKEEETHRQTAEVATSRGGGTDAEPTPNQSREVEGRTQKPRNQETRKSILGQW